MADVLLVEEIQILAQQPDDSVLQEVMESIEIVDVAEQGPRGAQGNPGPPGGTTPVQVGAFPLSGHSAVALDANGLLIPADCSNLVHLGAVAGVIEAAYTPGDMAVVRTSLPLEHAGWTWTPGPIFVGIGGSLTQTVPPGAEFIQVIGRAVSATRVLIDVQPPISTV